MKTYLLAFCLLLTLLPAAHAQMGINSPAGVRPVMDLEVYSRNAFFVQQKYRPTTTNPLASTNLIGCTTGSNPPIYAEAGIIMDPSGYTGYANNVAYNCTKTIYGSFGATGTVVGIELIIEQLDLGPAGPSDRDYLFISSDNFTNMPALSGTDNPGRIVIPDTEFRISFSTTNDGIGGRGFRIQWRALYADTAPTPFPLWATTNQFRFSTQNGALFSGLPPDFRGWQLGDYSVSLGQQNMARANASVAIGRENVVGRSFGITGDGISAVAIGYSNFASGNYSAAIGHDNNVSGLSSVGMGYRNIPSGAYAIAMGNTNGAGANAVAIGTLNAVGGSYGVGLGRSNNVGATDGVAIGAANSVPTSATSAMAIGTSLVASGNFSTAMGTKMTTNGQTGAFMIGDTDPLNQGITGAGAPDQFVARFRNGYYLMTSGTSIRTGVLIAAGQNAWGSISDSTKKERLLPMNHADILRKIGAMKLSSWNYKGQREIRHYGPMAQDFYAAFGHDALGPIGCDTLIYSHDFSGVTFAGVQALIRENEQLKAKLTDVNTRLQLIERALLTRRERVSLRKSKP